MSAASPADTERRVRLLARARELRRGDPVPSPCNSVCRIEPATGLCAGCLRDLDEIAHWSGWGDAERRATWLRIEQRASRLPA
ncbi:DUF1289 domain-containing protein [Ramlibacter sp. AW1]|uniref:DUF1289 domain-containing protein n=1 Tax=Ramlibacter aurantiacus TaxID=2801330 RepID=A0A936ZQR0_9BURK|nr:DUF1289 domain-containing protein [Ramlibacter aurantiacus]MBL0421743.1 DUF1289 domain-containing protein [Ramlibacter aurantiacus]